MSSNREAVQGNDRPAPHREFRASDAEALSRIYRESVCAGGPRYYTVAQIEAWAARAPTADALCRRYQDGRSTFIATGEGDQPIGFTDLEPDGHIDLLYVAPSAMGRGVATRLLQSVERAAREQGIERMFAEASDVALPVFERAGFVACDRREVVLGGVVLHNTAVEKRLSG